MIEKLKLESIFDRYFYLFSLIFVLQLSLLVYINSTILLNVPMKKLLIVRHAKSDWETGITDFNRPLNNRGIRVAQKMAVVLKDEGVSLDSVICSPAKRTQQTAQLLLNGVFDRTNIILKESIYEGTFFKLLNLINNDVDDSVATLMLIGHNPGVTELVDYLSSANIGGMPTCSCVCLTTEVDSWKLASKGIFSMEWNIYPKMFSF